MNFFSKPIAVGKLIVPNRVFLAPLAGVSDIPFRRICQELGAGLTYVEMLSAVAISYKNKRTFEMMARHKSENILGVQVTGPSADLVSKAIHTLTHEGFDTIDINMGCPVRKVVSTGCGSAILKEPDRISDTLKMARQATHLPLSAKVRLGYTREEINIADTTARIIENQADMITIHGRTRSENYSVPVDFGGISVGVQKNNTFKNEKSEKKTVAVGNGDIFGWQSAFRMQKMTGCDAVMVSRGALGNPWIFAEILQQEPVFPSFSEWYDVVNRHISYHEEHYGNTRTSAILLRKHLLWYCKGFPGFKVLREKCSVVDSISAAKELLEGAAKTIKGEILRFSGSGDESVERPEVSFDPKFEMDRKLDRGVGDETGHSLQ